MTDKKPPRVTTLHRVCWDCPDMGNRQAWFTTWNHAMRFARKERIADGAHFETVDVPKSRVALCDWLNHNFSTDNG